ncbi:unnamed protein product [Pleuronectes platessa]|uniref:Uncharacterized protein n=1 Tax=Pleuronectes platessa TaxID=8262 RepID=A0A9N7UZQ4_PLEPL|nr:unnamed protein product [Pleuronectes platessa]
MKLCYDLRAGVAVRHVKVKPRCAVLTMLKRLDKIRFRGPRTRDEFPDLAESPPASDNECSDDMPVKPKSALRDTEDLLRDPAGSGSPTMAAAIQEFQRSESDRLNEVKGHLEIALLEKHFLREDKLMVEDVMDYLSLVEERMGDAEAGRKEGKRTIAHRSGGSAHRHRALAQRDTVRSELVHVKSVTLCD